MAKEGPLFDELSIPFIDASPTNTPRMGRSVERLGSFFKGSIGRSRGSLSSKTITVDSWYSGWLKTSAISSFSAIRNYFYFINSILVVWKKSAIKVKICRQKSAISRVYVLELIYVVYLFYLLSFYFRWRSHCLIFISYISVVRYFFFFLFFDYLIFLAFFNSVFLMWFSLLLHQTNLWYNFSVPPPYEPPPPPSSKFNSSQEINWKGFSLRKSQSRQKDLVW